MKHIKQISVTPRADAFTQFFTAFGRAWSNFQADKKYEYNLGDPV